MTTVKTQKGSSHGRRCPAHPTLSQYLAGSGLEIDDATIPPAVQLELLKHVIGGLVTPHLKHLGLRPFREACPKFFRAVNHRHPITKGLNATPETRMVALLPKHPQTLAVTGSGKSSEDTSTERDFFLCENGHVAMVTTTSKVVNYVIHNDQPALAVIEEATDHDILEHIIHGQLLLDVLGELDHLTILARNRAQCRAEELFRLHCSIEATRSRSGAGLPNEQ